MAYEGSVNLESLKPFEHLHYKLQGKKKALGEKLDNLDAEAKHYQEVAKQVQRFQPFIDVQGSSMNGTECLVQQTNKRLQETGEKLEQATQKFQATVVSLKQNLEEIYEEANNLVENYLLEEVKQWQQEFKFKYAELAANENLDSFAPCCARTGKLLRDILRTDITRIEKAINDVTGTGKPECDQLYTQFLTLLISFYQRTFIVTKQDGGPKQDAWNIKKSTARTPKITLRILAADTFDALGDVEVHACFILESLINDHYDCNGDTLDFNTLKEKGWKIKKGKSTKFVQHRNLDTYEGTFSMDLDISLTRTKNVPVFEEKYRLIFYTLLENEKYWTMSLPMVVTTGGNQHCQCLASIMWQCFSTDVFAIPTETVPDLPWSKVAEMLQAKLKNLPSSRILTEDNIQHLKERLIGTAGAADDTLISLRQFCTVPLPQAESSNTAEEKKEEFTFWTWFLSIYNLVKTYLLDCWEKGWIEGFLSKEMAERKLKESKTYKPGTFLLRFSDQNIDKSQGKDAVIGKVASSVLFKNNRGHREVQHVDLIGQDRLKVMHLTNIVLETLKEKNGKNLYNYLYPKIELPCEKLFQRYPTLGPVVHHDDGYNGVTPAFIANLVQDFNKLELGGKRTISCPDSDSEDDKNSSDETASQEVSEAKRLKSNKSDPVPSLQQLEDINVSTGETNMVTGETNIVTDETNIVTGETNIVTGETNMVTGETNIVSELAVVKTVPSYRSRNASSLSVLRKLLTEPHGFNEAPSKITQNGSVTNCLSTGNTEHIENSPTTQNSFHNIPTVIFDFTENVNQNFSSDKLATFHQTDSLVNSSCTAAQMASNQNQAVSYQWTQSGCQQDQSNTESIQDTNNQFSFCENSNIVQPIPPNIQFPVWSHTLDPNLREIPSGGNQTSGENQSGGNQLFGPTGYIQSGGNQITSPNIGENLPRSNQMLSPILDQNHLGSKQILPASSAENQSGGNHHILSPNPKAPSGSDQIFIQTLCENRDTRIMSPNSGGNQPPFVLDTATNQLPSVNTAVQENLQSYEHVKSQSLTDEMKTMKMIQEYLTNSPPETAIAMLKPYLESLPPPMIMEIIPLQKIIMQIVTPYLKKLPPKWNSVVIQALQNSIDGNQSSNTLNQIETSEIYVTTFGLDELEQHEIEDGLSVTEDKLTENMDDINSWKEQKKFP